MPSSIVIIVGSSDKRDGTDEDVNAITTTFRDTFNSEIHNWIDVSQVEVEKKFCGLKRNPEWLLKFQKCRFVAVVCLAHGSCDGQVCLTDDDEAKCPKHDILEILTWFLNPLFKIKELNGKLKWLIGQTCRGNLNDLAVETDYDGPIGYFLDYYIASYCTGEGTLSVQANRCGKIYIQELCRQVALNGRTQPLVEILNSVNDAVEQYGLDNNYVNFPRPVFDRHCSDDYKLIE